MQKVKKAIIPAAGLGTRFLPATKAMPKECCRLSIMEYQAFCERTKQPKLKR